MAVEKIDPNPSQPRKAFDDQALMELAQSIHESGVLQPILLRPIDGDRFHVIVGERRLRACKLLGMTHVPAIVKTGSDHEMLRAALVENIQRSDLNVIEEAQAYQAIIAEQRVTQDECARIVGKDRATVSNSIRILSLPRIVQDDLLSDRMTTGHAKALLSLDDDAQVLRARDLILKRQLNVRKTEQLCRKVKKSSPDEPEKEADSDPNLEYLASLLRSNLRTKVRFIGNQSRGKIEISYFSASDLERLIKFFGSEL